MSDPPHRCCHPPRPWRMGSDSQWAGPRRPACVAIGVAIMWPRARTGCGKPTRRSGPPSGPPPEAVSSPVPRATRPILARCSGARVRGRRIGRGRSSTARRRGCPRGLIDAATASRTASGSSARPARVRPIRPLLRSPALPRDPGGAVGRATRKPRADRLRQVGDEPLVLLDAPQHLALPTPLPRRRVGQTLPLGLLDGVGFGEDSLALVTPPAPAPPHDDRRQPTLPAGPAGECGVPARRNSRWTRSAQTVHTGPASSIVRNEPRSNSVEHSAHFHGLVAAMTSRSAGRASGAIGYGADAANCS